jgi:hypothetical protein
MSSPAMTTGNSATPPQNEKPPLRGDASGRFACRTQVELTRLAHLSSALGPYDYAGGGLLPEGGVPPVRRSFMN